MTIALLLALAGPVLQQTTSAEEFAPPDPPANPDQLGANIQRTMTLLATSTPQKRNRVRILFYGQSVTAGPWAGLVAKDLKEMFPNADLEIVNRAIGGYQAETLINTAEYDLYPFYPDLLIFHVYGGEAGQQEQIIARTRQRTTAEIMCWTSHFRWPRDLPRDGDPNDPGALGLYNSDETRVAMIRDLAKKYGCELAEVREALRAYLKQHDLYPKDTLGDSVHPNALGNVLIEKLILPYLRHDPKFPRDRWENMVRDVPVDNPTVEHGEGGALKLAFQGNRIDVIAAHTDAQGLGTARVLIDGKPPSECPELYYHCRPTAAPHVWWPAINRIDHEKPLHVEKWTARIIECDPEKGVLTYEVIGSKTGYDGKGDSKQRFVSNSGRVVIEPGMWMVNQSLTYSKKSLPEDYVVTWEVKPLFVDSYAAPQTTDPAREYATTLAQGLSNGPHTVELLPNGDGAVPVAGFRVYEPPLKAE